MSLLFYFGFDFLLGFVLHPCIHHGSFHQTSNKQNGCLEFYRGYNYNLSYPYDHLEGALGFLKSCFLVGMGIALLLQKRGPQR